MTMRNVKFIEHDFDEVNLRKEAESFDMWDKYTDPRYPDGEKSPFEVVYWDESIQNIPIAYKEGYRFLERFELLEYDWTILYHKLLANSVLIPHTDHGCVAAVNCILNDDDMNSKIQFYDDEGIEIVQYKKAIIKTDAMHSVKNGPQDRWIFKIGFSDISINELDERINNSCTT